MLGERGKVGERGKQILKAQMTSSFRLETKSKEITQPQIVQSIAAGVKWLGQERQCGLGLNKGTPSCEGKKTPKERLSYRNEF